MICIINPKYWIRTVPVQVVYPDRTAGVHQPGVQQDNTAQPVA